MATEAIRLNKELINSARSTSKAQHRSVPKQIEYWAMIGQISEDNPDLTYDMIRGILQGMADVEEGRVKPYTFTTKKYEEAV